jgi:hypothetical protein
MTRIRKTRTLLLAFTALSVLAIPVHAQTTSGNGGVLTIPGLDLPQNARTATQRSGITTSVGQALEDPVAASPSEISTVGDNLGNHTAIQDIRLNGNDLIMRGGDILSDGGRVLGIPLTPAQETEASSKYYVDQLGMSLTSAITVVEGDVQTLFERRINTPTNQGLTGGGPLSSDITLTVDGTVVRTGGDQTINGAKTFTGPVSLSGTRLLGVATPQAETDGVNKAYVDKIGETLGGQIDLVEQTFLTRRVDTGTGLSGGGDLSQNRTLAFDTSWGDGRYALRSRFLTAGDGLTGGGTLAADRAFAVDATVVRTSGNQNIAGNKTFTGLLAFSNSRLTSVGTPVVASDAATKGYVDGVRDALETDISALSSRRIDTGTGLLGGGDLSTNRTLTFDTSWGDLRYALRERSVIAGDGVTGGGDLSADRTVSVDATVVRTSGTQLIAGSKTFRQGGGTLFERASGQDAVLLRGRAGGVDGFSVTITPSPLSANGVLTLANGATTLVPGTMVATTRSVLTGDGLNGGGNLGADRTLSVDATVVRTTGSQSIGGDKSFTGTLSLSGNRLTMVGTPILATDAATKGYVDGVRDQLETDISAFSARRVDTGTGLLGGGDLSANRTLTFDTGWGDARYALVSRTISAGDGLSGGGTLGANRTFSVDGTVVRTTRSVSAGTGLTGGGDLAANRTLSFDAAWGDARYAEHLTSGFSNTLTYDDLFGLTGNGAATFAHSGAARPSDAPFNAQMSGLHIGNSWGRAQVLFPNTANRILFRNGTASNWSEVWHSGNLTVTDLAPITRSINTGTGLTGGGNLSADRTLSFDAAWGDARYALRARSLSAGTGLTGGGDLSANRTLSFDAVWGDARYATLAGAQTITGPKTFTSSPNFSNQRILGVATPTQATDGVNKSYVDTAVAAAAGTTYTAGTGLTLSGSAFEMTNIAAGSGTVGAVRYNGTTASAGRFYGGATAPTNTTRLNYDGALYATQLFDAGARVVNQSRSVTAGTGLTGGGTLAADRTIDLAANQIRRDATSTATGVLAYNGHAAANAQFYGGTTNPTSTNAAHRLNFQGSLYATRFYGTQYFYFSDATLKENVERIGGEEGLDLLRQIRPVRYDWKETGRESLGVIAQETAQVLPNLVDTDGNGIMSVDYIQLIAPLIASVQELDARVHALEAAARDRSEP